MATIFGETKNFENKTNAAVCISRRALVLGIGLKNQNRLIGNSEQSIIDYKRFSAFLPNIRTVVFR